jgi:hypothetical protein
MPLLRARLAHQRPKVLAVALQALGTMKPPAITPIELQAVMGQDPAPSVLGTAFTLLDPHAAAVPR